MSANVHQGRSVAFLPTLPERLEFFEAAQTGDNVFLEKRLAEAPDSAVAKNDICAVALLRAAKRGHVACVRALLPFCVKKDANRALLRAASNGEASAECVRCLIPFADPGVVDIGSRTPLILAAASGNLSAVLALLPVSDSEAIDLNRVNALMAAAGGGHAQCVRALASRGGASRLGAGGLNALMLAAWGGHGECVQALAGRSNLEQRNSDGQTALDIALKQKKWECADLLAASLSLERARGVRARVPEHIAMPRCAALIERRELAEALAGDARRREGPGREAGATGGPAKAEGARRV